MECNKQLLSGKHGRILPLYKYNGSVSVREVEKLLYSQQSASAHGTQILYTTIYIYMCVFFYNAVGDVFSLIQALCYCFHLKEVKELTGCDSSHRLRMCMMTWTMLSQSL